MDRVSKSRKQFMVSSILPQNEQNSLSWASSLLRKLESEFSSVFLEELRNWQLVFEIYWPFTQNSKLPSACGKTKGGDSMVVGSSESLLFIISFSFSFLSFSFFSFSFSLSLSLSFSFSFFLLFFLLFLDFFSFLCFLCFLEDVVDETSSSSSSRSAARIELVQ